MQNSWTILRLNATAQAKFVSYVNELYPDVILYFPVYKRFVRPAKAPRPIRVVKPVYPGYIFANLDLDSSTPHILTSTPTRASFVRLKSIDPDSHPTISTIPDRVIHEIMRLECSNQLIREEIRINPYYPGRPVRIHTPVADIDGIILRIMGKIRALVSTPLGRITVPVTQCELK